VATVATETPPRKPGRWRRPTWEQQTQLAVALSLASGLAAILFLALLYFWRFGF